MSLNNWLCKHFDEEKKGYVTIADVATPLIKIFVYIIFPATFIFLYGGMLLGPVQGIFPEDESTRAFLIAMLHSWILPIEIFVLVIIFIVALYLISRIKIAKCPLKEQEENK